MDTITAHIGQPYAENWSYVPELADEQREVWADALGFGLLKIETGWKLDGTEVALRLSGGNLSAHVLVAYISQPDLESGRQTYLAYFEKQMGLPNPYFIQ